MARIANGIGQFFPSNAYIGGSFKADPNATPLHIDHSHADVFVDDNRFAPLPSQHQHDGSSLARRLQN
jgi:hypothetical protein